MWATSYYFIVEFNGRSKLITADDATQVKAFFNRLGISDIKISTLQNVTDDTEVNIMLDEKGAVNFEDTFTVCKDAHLSWAQEIEIENQYLAGERYNIYRGQYVDDELQVSVFTSVFTLSDIADFNHWDSGFRLKELPLEPSLKLQNHSPTGFEIGYHGSGPAQLALAILLHEFGDPILACNFYLDFKDEVIAKLERGKPFAIGGDFVREWVDKAQHRNRICGENFVK